MYLQGITKGDDDAKLSRKLFEQQLKEKEKVRLPNRVCGGLEIDSDESATFFSFLLLR